MTNTQKKRSIAITTLLISLLIATIAVSLSYFYLQDTTQSLQKTHSIYNREKSHYQQAIHLYVLWLTYRSRFKALQNTAVWGSEQRLQWFNIFKNIQKILKIPSIQPLFLPQETLTQYQQHTFKFIHLLRSKMTLTMNIIHEEDIFHVFTLLKESSTALYFIKNCLLKKLPHTQFDNIDQGNLTFTCELHWFTLQDRNVSTLK